MIHKLFALGLLIIICCETIQDMQSDPFPSHNRVHFPLGTPLLDLLKFSYSCTRLHCPGNFWVFGHYALDNRTKYEDLKTYYKSSFQEECPGITMYHILYFGACLTPCNTTADCKGLVTENPASPASPENPGSKSWNCCPVRDIVMEDRVELRCIPHS